MTDALQVLKETTEKNELRDLLSNLDRERARTALIELELTSDRLIDLSTRLYCMFNRLRAAKEGHLDNSLFSTIERLKHEFETLREQIVDRILQLPMLQKENEIRLRETQAVELQILDREIKSERLQ